MSGRWPPIIEGVKISRWRRAKGWLLTLIAWGVLLYLLQPLLHLLWAILLVGLGAQDALAQRQAHLLINDLLPFLAVIGLFALWLVSFAFVRRRRLADASRRTDQPGPLELERHAAHWGLTVEQVRTLQAARISVVHFKPNGDIEKLTGRIAREGRG
ncbi:poly-beta-1,6-N-acetyl-D-glucosamine biosynthesis protein PgaD [Microbulbifer sp. SAOS-129_SWC]|uniref:poly-beta-1,6-N-acetyl-D-glucosamine biosynthesis protein PgaD n=1 Tax=Microbulbifer sp. SAOS-129_SWC TaxID=3145235 RepID=UPI003217665A